MVQTQTHILKHSKAFLEILNEASPDTAIRAITHSEPVLVFWVTPEGKVLDAKDAHHKNPPNGDRSILSDKTNKGHLRGRAAFIGKKLYVVIYGDEESDLSRRQHALLRRSYPKILAAILSKGASQDAVDSALFITETGTDIEV